MNNEIKMFKNHLSFLCDFLSKRGYEFIDENIFNQHVESNIFYKCTFINNKLNRSISVIFYPSQGEIISNEIEIYFTDNDTKTSFTIPAFLAYKKLNRRLRFEDMLGYRFKLKTEILDISINKRLQEIVNILSTDLNEVLITSKWINIPVHDLRDDY